MNILGINDGHQSSAALIIDGHLVAAIAEERFTRRKNEHGYPKFAIDECLRIGDIDRKSLDRVAVATKYLPPDYFFVRRDSDFSIKDFWKEQTDYWYPVIYENKDVSFKKVFENKIKSENFVYDRSFIKNDNDTIGMQYARKSYISKNLGIDEKYISFKDHHASHAYYGLMASPDSDKKRLVFTTDGFGDGSNASIWITNNSGGLSEFFRTDKCYIGRMYRYATLLLGMKPAEHEFKVMGLAPYANVDYCQDAYNVYADTLQVNGLDFSYKKTPKDNFFYFRDLLKSERFDAIAYGIQRRTEELLSKWIENGVKETNINNIIISGGVAQNIKANKCIWEMDCVQSLFVPPGPHDESLSIGAAYMESISHNKIAKSKKRFSSAYLGSSYSKDEIKNSIDKYKGSKNFIITDGSPDIAAKLLSQGEVIGCFQGRMEFGARALGNRSIIANPSDQETIQRINDQVKKRDFWMPFAPSIKAERESDYLVNPKNIDGRYMTMAFESTNLGKRDIPAALHPYDKTARPNIVHKKQNPHYHALISSFEKITGIGALLNTSFNLHGEPVVESPYDALSTFERSGMRHLYIGDFIVSKKTL